TEQVSKFLQASVTGEKNIVISGGTGSGKTTLLNCISAFIPRKDRIVTIEDTAELQLKQDHVVSLESRPANMEGKGEITIRDLVKNALRMRPDRIVVGECRGAEALDMLQAMNTGHDGSMTTGHANSPADMMRRLEVMVLTGTDMPISAIREQIVSAVDLVVQLNRLSDGSRKITCVSEVIGINENTGEIITEDIFKLKQTSTTSSQIYHTGYIPTFVQDLLDKDIMTLDTFF
ncbi:MAG: CpaF/VirB11 family protein, partial [Gammaproteobacteria bacterium]|nr:CpaF/VirB11 family protein [Gammaproteobacteria bacterium]